MRHLAATVSVLALLAAAPAGAGEPVWIQIAQLFGSDTDTQDSFGERVAIDGDTLVVGAFRKDLETGAAYIFERLPGVPTEWVETKRLLTPPGDDSFGKEVAVSGDLVVVHSNGVVGMTNIYQRDAGGPGAWGQVARFGMDEGGVEDLVGSTLVFGDLREDVDGKLDAGAVHLFQHAPDDPGDWHYVATLTASDAQAQDHFGQSAAMSRNRLLIGAPQVRDQGIDSGAAYVFERDEAGEWMEVVKLLRPGGDDFDDFGAALDLDVDTALIAGDADGGDEAAFVFERDDLTGAWVFTQELRPSDTDGSDAFGAAAGISGDVAVVGTPSHEVLGETVGAVFVFERHQGGTETWGEVAKLLASEPEGEGFARNLAFDRNTLVVGARNNDDRAVDAGTAYLFSRTEPLLSVTGSCPGELAVSVIGTTPGGPVVVLAARSEGVTVIPAGPCAGTELGLEAPGVVFAGPGTSGGDLAIHPLVDEGVCGSYVQALDVGTCLPTAVVQAP